MERSQRVGYWRSLIEASVAPVEIETNDDRDFFAEITTAKVGCLTLVDFHSSPQVVTRSRSLVRSSNSDDYVAFIHSGPDTLIDHAGQQTRVAGHGVVLFDMTKPFTVDFKRGMNVVDVCIPRRELERALGPVAAALNLPIGLQAPTSRLIHSFFHDLIAGSGSLDETSAERLSRVGLDLLTAGFAERIGHEPAASVRAATIIHRVKAFIGSHYADSDLDVPRVAQASGISVRRLQEIFRDEPLSIVDEIWETRLRMARTMLNEERWRALPIASIAYESGFANPAHFSRRFRERYGLSPGEDRARDQERRAA